MKHSKLSVLFALALLAAVPNAQDIAVRGETVYTVSGEPISDGVVVVRDGLIVAVGPAAEVSIPAGMTVLSAAVVTPGLVDAHATVGLTGIYNKDHDQEQLEISEPLQPELRAIDAYNVREPLVAWVRSFGVTTVHTGHGPGELISGQTMVVKTAGNTVGAAVVDEATMLAATLGDDSRTAGPGKTPGTRARSVAMLRQAFVGARTYGDKLAADDADKHPARDLRKEALLRCLDGELALMVTAHRHHDILAALRLAEEFGLRLVLDGAAEAYTLIDEIVAAGVPVIVHPGMARQTGPDGERANITFENAALLWAAGIPIAQQSGFEDYVPKVRVALLEAGVAGAYGLPFDANLHSITLGAAQVLGVDARLGSLELGKDGDLALYDGDPFEYTTHCVGVIIEGRVVSDVVR
jgi:imidazolonepropionase-like amidohydrolase